MHSFKSISLALTFSVTSIAQLSLAQSPNEGADLFKTQCAECHDGTLESRAPKLEILKQRSPAAILEALTNGAMRVQGSRLNGAQRHAIAEFVSGKELGGDPTGAAKGRCAKNSRFTAEAVAPWNGWGATERNERFRSTKEAGIAPEQVSQLELKWAFGFPDATSAWATPTMAGGRVFVGSQNGTVYSLDAQSGCIYWYFSADGGVRTAIAIGPRKGGGTAVYFGDTSANAYALDAATGRQLWKVKVEEHKMARITGSPTLFRNRLYVTMSSYEESQTRNPDYLCCTFRGSVSSLDSETGKLHWRTYVIAEEPKEQTKKPNGMAMYGPSGAAIWSAPTIDAARNRVYVATGNGYSGPDTSANDAVVAVNLASGGIEWIKQLSTDDLFSTSCSPRDPNCKEKRGPDHDIGNAPILAKLAGGKERIVVGQKSGLGWALDPDNKGEVIWQYRVGKGGALGGMEWGSAVDATNAYFPLSDIALPTAGGLHAVNLQTGQSVWVVPPAPSKCSADRCNSAQAAAITVIPGAVFSGANDGMMRAYSTKDGSILWEFHTDREFTTVNSVAAKGASILGPGPTIANGMVFVSSGYGAFGGRPGNVLLAFGIPKK